MGLPALPLLVTLTIQSLVTMAIVTVPVLAPSAEADVGIAVSYVGMFIGLVYFASTICSIASGDLVRRFGAIRVSQICLLVSATGLSLLALGSVPAVICSALLLGLAQGPVTPASSHLLVRLTPPNALALVLSLKQTGVPLGGALAGALVPRLVLLGGWQFAACAVASTCLLLACLVQAMRSRYDSDRQRDRTLSMRRAIHPLSIAVSLPRVRRAAACALAFSALQLCVITYLVAYLTGELAYSLVEAGMMLALVQGTSIVARVAWGAVADRVRRPSALLAILAAGMSASVFGLGISAPDWATLTIAGLCIAIGLTAVGWNGVVLAEAARAAPRNETVEATSGIVFFTYCGVLVGPPVFSMTLQHGGGYAVGFGLLALPPLLCFFWLWWASTREVSAAVARES